MGKLAIIFSLAFLLMLNFETNAMGQNEIPAHITMHQYGSSAGENYGIKFEISGPEAKDVSKVLIETPDRKKLSFQNNLQFDTFLFSRDGMSFVEFKRRFPEGVYEINLTPKRYGRFKMNMTYNFPDVVITSPVDGATGVSLDPLIQWEPLSNISNLSLTVRSAFSEYGFGLSVGDTSFAAGYNYLMPDTAYDLSLEATTTDFEGNALVSTYTISFATSK